MDFQIVPVAEASIVTLMKSINRVIINPVIFFLFAVAMVYFLYGLVQYLLSPDNEEIRKKSKAQMIWGIVGLFIMVAVFGIMRIILATIGVNNIVIQPNGDYEVKQYKLDSAGNPLTDTNGDPILVSSDKLKLQDTNRKDYSLVGNYLGVWDAQKNAPILGVTIPPKDSYYIVSVPGITKLSNVLSWERGDIVYSDGTQWLKKLQTTSRDLGTAYDIATARTYANPPSGVYTANPFTGAGYTSTNLCWQEALYGKGTTEFAATETVKNLALAHYLDYVKVKTGIPVPDTVDSKTGEKLYKVNPTLLESQIFYDKDAKLYYVWWGAVGPVGDGTKDDCNRTTTSLQSLPQPTAQSTKKSSLIGKYVSDGSVYRAVDSGVSPDLASSRGIAITNALIQIAKEKGVFTIANIRYTTIDERYFPRDPNTGLYDYWVALQSPK